MNKYKNRKRKQVGKELKRLLSNSQKAIDEMSEEKRNAINAKISEFYESDEFKKYADELKRGGYDTCFDLQDALISKSKERNNENHNEC